MKKNIFNGFLLIVSCLCLFVSGSYAVKPIMGKGIDVSAHNGNIDWGAVKRSGIDFAILRLGYGGDMQSQDDKKFLQNVKGCEAAGVKWGAYLYSYALNTDNARSEARHAIRLLKGKKPEYPVFFDMEDADTYKKRHGMPSNQVLVDICDTFLNEVERNGYYVGLYASLSWFNNQLNSDRLGRYDKWVAQWFRTCTYQKDYGLWQNTSDGSAAGIGGRVDMNFSYRDYPSLMRQKHCNGF